MYYAKNHVLDLKISHPGTIQWFYQRWKADEENGKEKQHVVCMYSVPTMPIHQVVAGPPAVQTPLILPFHMNQSSMQECSSSAEKTAASYCKRLMYVVLFLPLLAVPWIGWRMMLRAQVVTHSDQLMPFSSLWFSLPPSAAPHRDLHFSSVLPMTRPGPPAAYVCPIKCLLLFGCESSGFSVVEQYGLECCDKECAFQGIPQVWFPDSLHLVNGQPCENIFALYVCGWYPWSKGGHPKSSTTPSLVPSSVWGVALLVLIAIKSWLSNVW